jgi:hypothetical protein
VRQRWFTVASIILACVLAPAAASAGVGTISTFAGSPVFGPVSATSLGVAGGVAGATVDGTPYDYVATGTVVRRIDSATGIEQVVAGDGGVGSSPSGTPALEASIVNDSVGVDAAGDIAILVSGNKVVFIPAASGTYFGETMTGGDAYILPALASSQAGAMAMNPQGDIAVANTSGFVGVLSIDTDTVTKVSGTGSGGTPPEGSLNNPAVAIDGAGDVAYAAGNGPQVAFVPKVAGTGLGQYTTTGSNPDVLVDVANHGTGTGFPATPLGDDGPATAASTAGPTSLAFDSSGDLLIADDGNRRVRFVADHTCSSACPFALPGTNAGYIYTVAGDGITGSTTVVPAAGTSATSDSFSPFTIGTDSSGNLLITAGLGVVTVSVSSDEVDPVAGNGTVAFSGDETPGAGAQLADAQWVATDPAGDVAIVDGDDQRIRFIPASEGEFYDQSMKAGDIYTVAGNGIPQIPQIPMGGGGDGGSATAPGATFSTFDDNSGIALDSSGDLVISDPANNSIRFVPAQNGTYYGQSMTAGDVYTIGSSASGVKDPQDVAVDAAGNVYIANAGSTDVIGIAPSGMTFPVDPLSFSPEGIAVDAAGDLAVSGENKIGFIPAAPGNYFGQSSLTQGDIYTIAGDGTQGDSGDGAAATSAELDTPEGLAFDRVGDIVIAQHGSSPFFNDYTDDAVRFLPASTGTFYGQSMAEGDIYTLAGGPIGGFSGDGGPAIDAKLAEPDAVAMALGEDVLIADSANARVRVITGSVPTATTGAAGTATAVSDTVNGSVNAQGRPIGYHFEYGTTTAYEASQPVPDQSVGSDHSEHPESQTLENLSPGTTYHYRIVATYDEAGATISVPGADATFTTERLPISVLGNSGTGSTGSTTSTSTSTSTGSSTGSSAGVASTPKAIEQLLLGCSGSPVVLNDVYIQGGHVEISGSAAKNLIGRKVKILFNEGKPVATATVGANGQYATTAPLPPAKIRDNPTTRYTAEIGKLRSLHLKLLRRLLLESLKASGTTVTLTGQVTPPLTKPIATVTVEQQLECGKPTAVKTFTPSASGRFDVTLTVPANAKAAIFRLTTKVAANKRSVKHGFTTFSLPLPVALG